MFVLPWIQRLGHRAYYQNPIHVDDIDIGRGSRGWERERVSHLDAVYERGATLERTESLSYLTSAQDVRR